MLPPRSSQRARKDSRWLPLSIAACAGLLSSQPSPAATLTWDPGHTPATPTGGSGTWDLTASNWASSTTTERPWTDTSAAGTDTARFAGTAGTVNLTANLTASQVIFATPGYTISGTNTLTLGANDATNNIVGFNNNVNSGTTTVGVPVAITQTQYWTAGGGSTLSVTSAISGNFQLLLAGGGNFSLTGGTAAAPSSVAQLYPISGSASAIGGYLNTTSTFDVNGGAAVNWTAVGNLNTGGGGLFIIGDNSSGTLNVTSGSIRTTPGSFVVGSGGNGTAVGTLNISGGAVTMGSNQQVYIGSGFDGNQANSTGVLTISGTGAFTTGTTTGNFLLGPNTGATVGAGTINLNGGTLATGRSIALGASTGATGTFNFNGGTLQATANNTTFMQGLTTANVRGSATANSGAVIDTQTFNVTVGQALVHSTINGDAARDGGLTKLGTGTLTLTGASTYTGTTTVSAGILSLTTASINASALVQVTAGALTLGNATALSDTGTLNLASGTTLNLNAGTGTSETIGSLILTNGNYAPVGTYDRIALGNMDAGVTFNSANGETLTVTAVPEPSTLVSGLLLLGVLARCCGVRFVRRRG